MASSSIVPIQYWVIDKILGGTKTYHSLVNRRLSYKPRLKYHPIPIFWLDANTDNMTNITITIVDIVDMTS